MIQLKFKFMRNSAWTIARKQNKIAPKMFKMRSLDINSMILLMMQSYLDRIFSKKEENGLLPTDYQCDFAPVHYFVATFLRRNSEKKIPK